MAETPCRRLFNKQKSLPAEGSFQRGLYFAVSPEDFGLVLSGYRTSLLIG